MDAIKEVIAEKIPTHFPREILDNEYGWLDHPDKCSYSPDSIEEESYTVETYGVREHDKPKEDHFYQVEDL